MNKRFICILLSLLCIVIPLKVYGDDAEIDNSGGTSETVSGDSSLTVPQFDENDFELNREVEIPGGTAKTSKEGDNYVVETEMEIPSAVDENGKIIPPKLEDFKFGKDALRDPKDSTSYKGDAFKKSGTVSNTMKKTGAKIIKKNGKYFLVTRFEGSKADFAGQSLILNAARTLKANLKNGMKREKALEIAIKKLGIKPENKKWFDKAVKELSKLTNQKEVDEYIKKLSSYQTTKIAIKYNPPPLKVIFNPPKPGKGACEEWNKLEQPGPVTCLEAGTKQGRRARCVVSKEEEYMKNQSQIFSTRLHIFSHIGK